MKSMKYGLAIACVCASIGLMGCDAVKSLFGHRSTDSSDSYGEDGEGGSRMAPPKGGFVVDDSGTMRMMPPTEIQQREGAAISTEERATSGSKSPRKGNNWIYDAKSKGGSFLVAAASKPGTVGGDMIRRIDLSKSISEHDYDSDTPGKQGAFIYVPDELRPAVPSKHVDGEGLYSGILCAMVPGPNQTIIAIGGDADGGVAFVLNPYEDAQAFTPLQAIRLPYSNNPCRAVYSAEYKKLYVVDVARTTSQAAQEGIYVADIYNDGRASTASLFLANQVPRINSHSLLNFQAIELYDDVLYLLSGNGRFDSDWDNVVYRVPLNKAGEPLFKEMKYTRTQNPTMRQDGCAMSHFNIADLKAFESNGKGVLLTSGTRSTVAWELGGDELKKIDMNPKKPGTQSIDFSSYGQGGPRFAIDPVGGRVFQLPHCRSNSTKVKIANDVDLFAVSIMALDTKSLTTGDPIDIGYLSLLKSLKDARYRPQFNMTARDFAVGPHHIAVIGAAASNNSGLGAGSDISIIDRSKNTNIAFNKPKDMRLAHEINYGFKLAQGDAKFDKYEQNSHAIIWIP